jgi:hypothetical protein
MGLPETRKVVRTAARAYSRLDEELERYARLGTSASAALQKEEILNRVAAIAEQLDDEPRRVLEPWIRAEQEILQAASLELGHRLALELEQALSEHDISLSGQLPQLHAACLVLRVDLQRRAADLMMGPEVVRTGVGLDANSLAAVIRSTLATLDSSPFDPVQFLSHLKEAHNQLMGEARGGPRGAQVSLPDVLARVAFLRQSSRFRRSPIRENFVSYPRWQFGYDLFRLRESSPRQVAEAEYRLIVATMDAAKSRDKYIWVPDDRLGNGTRYAYLRFGGHDVR